METKTTLPGRRGGIVSGAPAFDIVPQSELEGNFMKASYMTDSAQSSLTLLCGSSKSLPMRILRARERLIAPIRLAVARSGLTEQQWRILSVLDRQGSMDATRLAEECGLLLPSQTRIVHALLDKGYLVRKQDTEDRRRYTLAPTEAGQAVVERHRSDLLELSQRVQDKLGQHRLDLLFELLDELENM